MTPEFSRYVDVRRLGERPIRIGADAGERAALAARFGIEAIDRLEAEVMLTRRGETVHASGRLEAEVVQSCAVSGEPLRTTIREPVELRFVPARTASQPDEEIELDAQALDEIEYSGSNVDLGEAVAQSLALAIDPYATGPDADRARAEAGLLDAAAAGPFAALAALRPTKED